MTTPLTPAAQAVIDASWGGIPSGMRDPYVVRCEQMAAAIRVAVEQVQARQYGDCYICDSAKLLAIAAELEAQQ